MGALHRQALPVMLLLKGPWRCAKSFRCVSLQVKAGSAHFSELCWCCGLPAVLATKVILRAAVIASRACASHRISSAVHYHAQQGAEQLENATQGEQPAAVKLLNGVQQANGRVIQLVQACTHASNKLHDRR